MSTITFKGQPITHERTFNPSDIYGGIGALANTLFGGPRTSRVTVHPMRDEVTIVASYGSYTVKGDDINTNSILRKMKLYYQR